MKIWNNRMSGAYLWEQGVISPLAYQGGGSPVFKKFERIFIILNILNFCFLRPEVWMVWMKELEVSDTDSTDSGGALYAQRNNWFKFIRSGSFQVFYYNFGLDFIKSFKFVQNHRNNS